MNEQKEALLYLVVPTHLADPARLSSPTARCMRTPGWESPVHSLLSVRRHLHRLVL
jgi:hypothetical protein